MTEIYLVACASAKLAHAAAARDLYDSALFTKSRAFAERASDRWYILSAKHGLVAPDAVLEPYDMTLSRLGVAARRSWAGKVLRQLCSRVHEGDRVTFLAGKRYREFLEGPLRVTGLEVRIPLEGLRIGEQLSRLDELLRAFA